MNSSEQKKKGYHYNRENLYTVIIFLITESGTASGYIHKSTSVLKYHNVAVDNPGILEAFKKFVSGKWPAARYMNIYGGMSGDYYKRVYF